MESLTFLVENVLQLHSNGARPNFLSGTQQRLVANLKNVYPRTCFALELCGHPFVLDALRSHVCVIRRMDLTVAIGFLTFF